MGESAQGFEGSEKRLEVVFAPSSSSSRAGSLRSAALAPVLRDASCTVVTSRRGATFDAYVLSESSLFVYDRLCVAKTCGTTCLLNACRSLVYAGQSVGLQPARCTYSHPSFQFPWNQPLPHRSFEQEIAALEASFGHLRGGTCAHVLGSSISGLQLFVYAADDHQPKQYPSGGHDFASDDCDNSGVAIGAAKSIPSPCLGSSAKPLGPLDEGDARRSSVDADEPASLTLEVSMKGLSRSSAAHFYNSTGDATVEGVAKDSGIIQLCPGAALDGIVFSPCGYSLNAVHQERFLTVHVTPEEQCSYASVELGGPGRGHEDPARLVEQVLDIFKPQTAAITLSGSASRETLDSWEARSVPAPYGYRRAQLCRQALRCGGFVHFATLEAGSPASYASDVETPRLRSPSQGCSVGCYAASSDADTESTGEPFDGICIDATNPKVMRWDEEEAALRAIAEQYGAKQMKLKGPERWRKLVAADEELVHAVDLSYVLRRWRDWQAHMPRATVCYAVKSNADLAILQLLASLGSGFDCASPEEIERVLSLGVPPARIVYANPSKPPSHAKRAEALGVTLTVVDTPVEVEKIALCMPSASALLRIKAGDPTARCPMEHKYGASESEWLEIINTCAEAGISLRGISFHIGSGASEPGAFADAVSLARRAINAIKESNARPRDGEKLWVDIGGGLSSHGATVSGEAGKELSRALNSLFPDDNEVSIIAEPGRFISEGAVTVLAEVIGARRGKKPAYWIKDGLYGSFNCMLFDHAHCPVPTAFALDAQRQRQLESGADVLQPSYVFGPTCDGLDTLLTEESLPSLAPGNWLAFPAMGAYTQSAASAFNGFHPLHDGFVRYIVTE